MWDSKKKDMEQFQYQRENKFESVFSLPVLQEKKVTLYVQSEMPPSGQKEKKALTVGTQKQMKQQCLHSVVSQS